MTTSPRLGIPPGRSSHGWIPDPVQELAILAATGDATAAAAAWDAWLDATGFDTVDPGSHFVLSLVRHNLNGHLGDDNSVGAASAGRLRGIARRSWYESQLIMHRGSTAIDALQSADLDVCVLGDAATAARWFPEISLRPVSSIELLVRETDAEQALARLRQQGWHCLDRSTLGGGDGTPTAAVRRVRPGVGLTDGIGSVTLRWHAFDDCCWDHADDEIWARTEPFALGDRQVIGLDPSLDLIRTAVHGVRGGSGAVPWVCDSILIAKARELDWSDIMSTTTALRLVVPFALAMDYLVSSPHGIVPAGISPPAQTSWLDRHCLVACGPPTSLLHPKRVLSSYGRYRRSRTGSPTRWSPGRLADHVRCAVGVRRHAEVPAALARRVRRDIGARIARPRGDVEQAWNP